MCLQQSLNEQLAQKAWIALEASNVPYQMEEISLYGPNGKPNWFWKLNPKGTVPTLVASDGASSVYTDSEDILNSIGNLVQDSSSRPDIVPSDEDSVRRDKEFRQKLTEFLPIGKSAVLGYGSGKEGQMWNKLQELTN